MSRQKSDPHEARQSMPLFDAPVPTSPLHHRDDPVTSRESAAALRETPRLAAEQSMALAWVRIHRGRTCLELARLIRLERGGEVEYWRQRIGRRLSELWAAKLIEPREVEVDPETGRKGQRWWPVEGSPEREAER